MKSLNMVFDLSNIVWSTRFSALKKVKDIQGLENEMLLFEVFQTLKRVVDKYNPDGIIIACDSKNIWRKKIYPDYKANRDSKRDVLYDEVLDVMKSLKTFFNTCTNIPAISVDTAEADDIIATIATNTANKLVIVSSDKDFIQLISHDVRLYAHTLKKERVTIDRDFDLFEKCIRGDVGDNIFSAYPRVRKVKLEQAWNDPMEMLNIIETIRPDGKKVGDVLNFNVALIDLSKIPMDIRNKIIVELNTLLSDSRNYNQINILKFLGENNLKAIAHDINKFNGMFKKGYII